MKIREYQEGGNMPSAPATGAPAGPEGGQDPIMQIADIFAQGLQSGDCNMLAQGAQMFIQLISQAMNQAGPQGPVDQAPEGEPVFKKGGKIVKRKKCSK
jgi:hypothetical protein